MGYSFVHSFTCVLAGYIMGLGPLKCCVHKETKTLSSRNYIPSEKIDNQPIKMCVKNYWSVPGEKSRGGVWTIAW